MSKIVTPNWRLAAVSPRSTGHQYVLARRGEVQNVYFDDVKIYRNVGNEIHLREDRPDRESGWAKSGEIGDADTVDGIIFDGLKHIEEHDRLPKKGEDNWREFDE